MVMNYSVKEAYKFLDKYIWEQNLEVKSIILKELILKELKILGL